MESLKYDDLTWEIIGCAMKVHTALGNGFQEVIYQRALEIEFIENGLLLKEKKKCPFIIKRSISAQDVSVSLWRT